MIDLEQLIEGQAFKTALNKIPKEYLAMDEADLRKIAKPTKTDYSIRSSLWNEIRLASEFGTPIKIQKVFFGICTYTHFYNNILGNPKKLAWVLLPVQKYEKSLEPLLLKMAERYDELLSINIYDKKGKPIPQLVRQVIQVMILLENRLAKTQGPSYLEERPLNQSPMQRYLNLSSKELDEKVGALESQIQQNKGRSHNFL